MQLLQRKNKKLFSLAAALDGAAAFFQKRRRRSFQQGIVIRC